MKVLFARDKNGCPLGMPNDGGGPFGLQLGTGEKPLVRGEAVPGRCAVMPGLLGLSKPNACAAKKRRRLARVRTWVVPYSETLGPNKWDGLRQSLAEPSPASPDNRRGA